MSWHESPLPYVFNVYLNVVLACFWGFKDVVKGILSLSEDQGLGKSDVVTLLIICIDQTSVHVSERMVIA